MTFLAQTWNTKAGYCLATVAGACSNVHHASLLTLGAVGWLLLTPVCKVGLRPPTETLAGCGTHIDHVISLAPVTSAHGITITALIMSSNLHLLIVQKSKGQ